LNLKLPVIGNKKIRVIRGNVHIMGSCEEFSIK